MEKLIIEVRVNEYTSREPNPNVPFSATEIGEDAAACREAGAAIIHYHARDPLTGAPSSDPQCYADGAREIRERSDLLVMPTLGANTVPDLHERFKHIDWMARAAETRADLVPLDLASLSLAIWNRGDLAVGGDDLVYYNSVGALKHLAEKARAVKALPMAAIWNIGSLRLLEAFSETGILPSTIYTTLFLTEGGLISGNPCTRQGLDALIDFLPRVPRCVWSFAAYGANILSLAEYVIERGGHVAIGLGDYPYLGLSGEGREAAPTNSEIVDAVVQIARWKGREIATPEEARALLEGDN